MKTVRLSDIQPPDRSSNKTLRKRFYHVYLGAFCLFVFGSEKDAKRFLADRSRELTQLARAINRSISELHHHHRVIWLYDDPSADEISRLLEAAHHSVTRATSHTIQDTLKLIALSNAVKSLQSAADLCSDFFFNRTQYDRQHNCQIIPLLPVKLWQEFETFRVVNSRESQHKEIPDHIDIQKQLDAAGKLLGMTSRQRDPDE